MTDHTHQTQGARLLVDLSERADALVDAIEDFGGDDLLAQATDLANRVAIAKAVLLPFVNGAEQARAALTLEPLKVRAIDWNWRRLDEVRHDDVVWDDERQEWSEVEWVNEDMSLAGRVVKILLALGNGGSVAGKPTDVVRVADQALALEVDAYVDELHEHEMDRAV